MQMSVVFSVHEGEVFCLWVSDIQQR